MDTQNANVVVITGAAGNVGRAIAHRFAAEGARLALLDRDAGKLNEVAASLGVDAMVEAVDILDPVSIAAAFDRIEARAGAIRVVAHTVGGFASGKPIHETDLEVLEQMFRLNTKTVWLVGGEAARRMIASGTQGRIVVITARAAGKGAATMGAYTASKAAASRLVESMAAELRDHGITVNAIAPSTIDTPPNRQSMPSTDPAKWVTPDQIADAIAYLASPAAQAITGATIELSGRV